MQVREGGLKQRSDSPYDAIVIRIIISKFSDPSKIGLIKVRFEVLKPMLQDAFWVQLVKRLENVENVLLLLKGKEGHRATL
jgi:hypothetical protein